LLEALLNVGLHLTDEALLGCRNHAANHVAADGAPKAGRDVAAVPAGLTAQVLLKQMGLGIAGRLGDLLRDLVAEPVESLTRLANQRLVRSLTSSHNVPSSRFES